MYLLPRSLLGHSVYRLDTLETEHIGSPQLTLHFCTAWAGLADTARALHISPITTDSVLTSARVTASSSGFNCLSMLYIAPTAILFTLRSIRYRTPRKTRF